MPLNLAHAEQDDEITGFGTVTAKSKRLRPPAYQSGISAEALMAMQFSPIRFVVNGYLAEGVTIFAGAPKIGKSWMLLGLAIAVASGRPAFGSIPCRAGDTLYLALEDNPRRLQSRMLKMGISAPPERLTFCTSWPCLDDGAVNEIEQWILSVENPTLIIVDVLAKVRAAANGKDSAYDGDYRTMTGLQELAGKYGVAIVAMHHTRKMDADDAFDSVSGTRGLTGAADTVLVLKRDSVTGRTVLYGRGRDIEEIETAFEFNSHNATWTILGAVADFAKTDERQEILNLLRSTPNPLTPLEVSDLLGKRRDAVRQALTRMARDGEIEKAGRGQYTSHSGHNVTAGSNTAACDHVTDVTDTEDRDGWIGRAPWETGR